VRDGSRPCRPRTQSSIAVSPDYRRWFLFNASPDIHAQIGSCPALHPTRGPGGEREVPVQAVLLTDAQLAALPIEHKIYIHINNTNPILLDDSPVRRTVGQHGMQVATDGLELQI
jgi:phosphoribosyl 1,2-cyclic phosphodiesterase